MWFRKVFWGFTSSPISFCVLYARICSRFQIYKRTTLYKRKFGEKKLFIRTCTVCMDEPKGKQKHRLWNPKFLFPDFLFCFGDFISSKKHRCLLNNYNKKDGAMRKCRISPTKEHKRKRPRGRTDRVTEIIINLRVVNRFGAVFRFHGGPNRLINEGSPDYSAVNDNHCICSIARCNLRSIEHQ